MKFTERRDSHFFEFEADGAQDQKASTDLSDNLGPRVQNVYGTTSAATVAQLLARN